MGDRVFFLADITDPTPLTGGEGFPFRIDHTSPPPITPGVSFDVAIAWWWQVQFWSLSTDASVVVDGTTYDCPTGTMVSTSSRTRELDLVHWNLSPSWALTGTGDTIVALSICSAASDQLIESAGVYYPSIEIHAAIGIAGDTVHDLEFSANPDFWSPASPDGSIVGKIDDLDITIYYKTTAVDSFTFTSFILTRAGDWPYG